MTDKLFRDPLYNDVWNYSAWEVALRDLVRKSGDFDPPEMYCLCDKVKGKYNEPYFREKNLEEQSPKTAISIMHNGRPTEISELLDRLQPVTESPGEVRRYYIPEEAIKRRFD